MRLRVVEPCHEDWDALDAVDTIGGSGRVRHCASCDRSVHDLTQLTDRAAIAYAMLHADRDGFCGRIRIAPPTRPSSFACAPRSTLAAATLSAIVGCATPSPSPSTTHVSVADAETLVIAPMLSVPAEKCEPSAREVAAPAPASLDAPEVPPKVVVVVMGRMSYVVPHVEFAHNSAKVSAEAQRFIVEIAAALRDHPEIVKVRVVGNAATNERNAYELSVQRSHAIASALVDAGVVLDRLDMRGDGVAQPLADNATRRGRAMNRNVTFEIVSEGGIPLAPSETK